MMVLCQIMNLMSDKMINQEEIEILAQQNKYLEEKNIIPFDRILNETELIKNGLSLEDFTKKS